MAAFGITGLLFSKNLPLLIGVIGIDYLGMFALNLGEIVESYMFFLMILLTLLLTHTVHSFGTFIRLLFILLAVDFLLRVGLYTLLPKELTSVTMEKIISGNSL